MLVVRVELWSAITGEKSEIARMHICNEGGNDTGTVGHYGCQTFRGRDADALARLQVQRKGKVANHRRLDLHVWHLVGKALTSMGYGAAK